jgi:uncharacterized SAM-binding protein YcdF (DUF218 family)
MQSQDPQQQEKVQKPCLRHFRGCTSLIVIAALIGLVGIYFLLRWMGSYLIVADPLHKADAIVVLSGDMGRIDETARLYKDQLAEWLIITETGQPSDNGEEETTSTKAKRLDALKEGIPEEAILTTAVESSSTLDEAHAVLSLMQEKMWTSCIVVTDPYHSRRTRKIFNDVFKGSGIQVMLRPVNNYWYRSSTWFYTAQGWETTIREYIKYFAYLMGVRGD